MIDMGLSSIVNPPLVIIMDYLSIKISLMCKIPLRFPRLKSIVLHRFDLNVQLLKYKEGVWYPRSGQHLPGLAQMWQVLARVGLLLMYRVRRPKCWHGWLKIAPASVSQKHKEQNTCQGLYKPIHPLPTRSMSIGGPSYIFQNLKSDLQKVSHEDNKSITSYMHLSANGSTTCNVFISVLKSGLVWSFAFFLRQPVACGYMIWGDPRLSLGQTTTLGDSEREGRIGLD